MVLGFLHLLTSKLFTPIGTSGKESACQWRRHKRHGFNPWIRKIPRIGNGNLLQYSCLENPMDRGAWQVAAHGVTKSWTRLSTYAHCFKSAVLSQMHNVDFAYVQSHIYKTKSKLTFANVLQYFVIYNYLIRLDAHNINTHQTLDSAIVFLFNNPVLFRKEWEDH